MEPRILGVDVGGSGCRAAWVEPSPDGRHVVGRVHDLGTPGSRSALAGRLAQTFGPFGRLGVSTAGIVDADRGAVRLCRVAPWMNGEVVRRLKEELGDCHVALVNDGEVHLLAHLALPVMRHPALCFSFGTAVGFAITNEAGEVTRPRSGLPTGRSDR